MSGRSRPEVRGLLGAAQGGAQKDWSGRVAVALAFPGTSPVALSDPDFQPTARSLDRLPGVVCERVVLPDPDDLAAAGGARTPLLSLESQRPLGDFDLIAFWVSAERDCVTILQMLALAGIPPLAAERTGAHPLLAMGGALASGNPEPLADVLDLVLVAEAEDGWGEVLEGYREVRGAAGPRPRKETLLRRFLPIEGIYVPRFYDVSYHPDGRVAAVSARGGAPPIVRKRRRKGGGGAVQVGGADLLVGEDRTDRRIVTLSLQAGTERLRRLVGAAIPEEEIFRGVEEAVHLGIPTLKLDFTIGLPTETEEDAAAIPTLAKKVRHHMLQRTKHAGRVGEVSVAVSCFVPRPWTRFQWCGFEEVQRLEDRLRLIKGELGRVGNIRVTHDLPRWAYLQALLARGDRRMSGLLSLAQAAGGDWKQALRAWHLNPDFYAGRWRALDEVFPWDHLEVGVTKEHLLREYGKAGLA